MGATNQRRRERFMRVISQPSSSERTLTFVKLLAQMRSGRWQAYRTLKVPETN